VAKSTDLLKRLISTSIQACDLQRIRLENLEAKDFPAGHSKHFISALLGFNREILRILRDKSTQFSNLSSEDDFDTLRDDIIQFMMVIWHMNYITHIVERSAREHVSESTVLLLAELTRKFKDSKLFVIPTHEYNYIYENLYSFLAKISVMLPGTKNIIDDLPDKLAVLSFPDIYKDNLIANSELAHEVGHFIDDLVDITTKIYPKVVVDQTKLRERLEKGVTGEGFDYLAIEKIRAKRLELVQYSIRRWIMELVSDLIALHLCGPAFVFALAELLLTKQYPEEATLDYPPSNLRLKILLEEMSLINFLDQLSGNNKKLVADLTARIDEHIKASKQRVGDEIIYDAIDSVLSEIKKEAAASTKGFNYDPQKFGNEVFPLIDRLKKYVPPCEIKKGKPADLISILNAGMIFRLSWKDHPPPFPIESLDDESRAVNIINSLVTKSIELSIIQQKMQEKMK